MKIHDAKWIVKNPHKGREGLLVGEDGNVTYDDSWMHTDYLDHDYSKLLQHNADNIEGGDKEIVNLSDVIKSCKSVLRVDSTKKSPKSKYEILPEMEYSDLNKAGTAHLPKGAERHSYTPTSEYGVIYIPINRLKQIYQSDHAINKKTVEELVQKMKNEKPLEPVQIGYNYDVHDGHHRIEACRAMNYTHVPCKVVGDDPEKLKQAKAEYRKVWKSENLYLDLEKSMRRLNFAKLVKKPVQVHGHDGSVFTRYQWVSPGDASTGHGVRVIKNKSDFNLAVSEGVKDHPQYKEALKAQGINPDLSNHVWGEHPHFYLPETEESKDSHFEWFGDVSHIHHGSDEKNHKIHDKYIQPANPYFEHVSRSKINTPQGTMRSGQFLEPHRISSGHGVRKITNESQFWNYINSVGSHEWEEDPNITRAMYEQGINPHNMTQDVGKINWSAHHPIFLPETDRSASLHRMRNEHQELAGKHFDHGQHVPDHNIMTETELFDRYLRRQATFEARKSSNGESLKERLAKLPKFDSPHKITKFDADKLHQGTPLVEHFASSLLELEDERRKGGEFGDALVLAHNLMGGITKEGLEHVFSHPQGKYRAEVRRFDFTIGDEEDNEEAFIGFNLLDRSGKIVGEVGRTIAKSADEYHIYNELLEMSSTAQNEGTTDFIYPQSEDLWRYMSKGHNIPCSISVWANITVGAYCWAKKGFEFENDHYKYTMLNDLSKWMKKHNLDVDATLEACGKTSDELRSPKDFSELDNGSRWDLDAIKSDSHKNLTGIAHLGKAFMLTGAQHWDGYKVLSDNE